MLVHVQSGLCRTCSETTLLVLPRGGSVLFENSSLEDFSGDVSYSNVCLAFEGLRRFYDNKMIDLDKKTTSMTET